MLAVTNKLSVTHISYHIFRRICSRHGSVADWSVVPQVFFFPLFENGGYVFPFPAIGNFRLRKYEKWLSNFIYQSHWMHLVRSHQHMQFLRLS